MSLHAHRRTLIPLALCALALALMIAIVFAAEPSPVQLLAGTLLLLALAPLLLIAGAVLVAPGLLQLEITPTHLVRRAFGRTEVIDLTRVDAIASLDVRSGRIVTPLLAALTGGGSDLRLLVVCAGPIRWHIQPRWYGLDHDALKAALDRALASTPTILPS